ncbi:MAG: (2Fe-2S) ferredoxin domain-containing protein [Candidatus Hydrogenedentes bacterium]|nr:(2Fe-2S) ferredoxin domain-containing protein [Candidatus Hydrogenedentota bacterium]
MDRCEDGPNVMIFPDNIWLAGVQESDLPALLTRLVEDLESPEL